MTRLSVLVSVVTLTATTATAGTLTHCEMNKFTSTPRYAETLDFVKRIEAIAPWMRYESFGVSPAGRELPLIICDKSKKFEPAAGKPVILVFNGIHAGEIDGKDACLMLLRDMTEGKYAEWLSTMTLLIVPILNVDGHERFGLYNRPNQNGPEGGMGFRVNAEGMNLNRDWMKLETPECRALVALYNEWRPQLVVDMHTSDGEDFQYDLQYLWGVHPSTSPTKQAYLEPLTDRIRQKMLSAGHKTSLYLSLRDSTDATSGVRQYPPSPRFSTSYFDLRDSMSILVETHADKDYRTRVLAARDYLEQLFSEIAKDPAGLLTATDAARRETLSRQAGARFAIGMEITDATRPYPYEGWVMSAVKSEVTGGMIPVYTRTPRTYQTTIQDRIRVTREIAVPTAYILEPGMSRIAKKLEEHGITVRRLAEAGELAVEAYRAEKIEFQPAPYQGHHPASGTFIVEKQTRRFDAGSYVVPGVQPETATLVYLLEPESGEGLFHWNYFDWIVEQKEGPEDYTMELWAAQMLKEPDIRREYQERLAKDEAFAKDPEKRLRFFYEKSPYFDREVGLYPVFRYSGPSVPK